MIWSIVALRSLGYGDDSPEMQYCRERLWGLVIEEDQDDARLQPCKSPVWDTALTLRALADSGLDGKHPAIERGVHWLLAQEIRTRGDWAHEGSCSTRRLVLRVRQRVLSRRGRHGDGADGAAGSLSSVAATDSGTLPPDLRLIADRHGADDARRPAACDAVGRHCRCRARRASHWMLAMQNRDGGWGAFDRDNTAEFLCHVPFADHNAMIDPSTPDLAARVLESLARSGQRESAIRQSIGRGISAPHARSRRQLVRPLGRELHLRHVAGADWLGGGRRAERRSDDGGRRQLARRASAAVRRLGRIGRQLCAPDVARPRARNAFANGLGDAGPDRRRQARSSGRRCADCNICWRIRTPTARGTKPNSPAPVSRACSICGTTTTEFTSR